MTRLIAAFAILRTNLKMETFPLLNTIRFWWWWVIYRYNLLLLDLLHCLTDFLKHYVSGVGSDSISRQYATDLLDPSDRATLSGIWWLRTAGSKGSTRLGTSCLKIEAEQAFEMSCFKKSIWQWTRSKRRRLYLYLPLLCVSCATPVLSTTIHSF